MRASQLYAPTLRETPAEAEIISHQLMLRAGLIHKAAAGIYSYRPMAWRVMKKIMDIIREEMDAVGGQELMLPTVNPAEVWLESGRWNVYGDELWRVKDRHGRDFCLAPTQEEMITTLVKNDVRSYKQLPLRLYQIQAKFRDERRPRFGMMRSREFIMKDMYSFDRDEEHLEESYRLLYEAYARIFSRCGLDCYPVEADSGAIGGSGSHQFMAIAASGEEGVLFCDACGYAASNEIAAVLPQGRPSDEPMKEIDKVETPDCSSVEDVAKFLNLPTSQVVKTLCYQADNQLVLVLVRGDRQINEIKLQHVLDCLELQFASEEAVRSLGQEPGYLGPVGDKKVRIIADSEVSLMRNHVCGAMQKDYHLLNVNPGRDYQIDTVADIRLVQGGEPCPLCGAPLQEARGIEVGQVFKLRTKYSSVLGARFCDENGQEQDIVMGCYGIGVGRTMAAVIEQSYDDKGIIWPFAIAPYHVVIVPVNDKDEVLKEMAESLYQQLLAEKVEVVLDDRRERPGVKFNDADLLGYPIRITIGGKAKESGKLELKLRTESEARDIEIAQVKDEVIKLISENIK